MSSTLVVHSAYVKPLTKKLKFLIDMTILNPTPLTTIRPITIDSIPYEQYTTNLFSSSSFKYSLIPPSKVVDKEKGIAKTLNDDIPKQVFLYMEEGGSIPNLPNLYQFRPTGEGPLILEEAKLQMQEIKRLV
nr:hypothetical protein [Tanacetum cinerariifolium]